MFKFLSKMVGMTGYVIQYGCVTHCTFEYIGDFVVCSGPSMEPTLHSDNILITERISPRFSRFNRGDIIVAKNPTNPTQHICKRVVGLPGDKIVTKSSFNPFSNALPSTKLVEKDVATGFAMDVMDEYDANNMSLFGRVVVVPRGHVWVEGDNSENSSDSRYYGPIPQGLIRSRALCLLWPPREFKLLFS